jgi:hypothetical protein
MSACFVLIRGQFGDTESWRNYYRSAPKIYLAFMSGRFSLVAIFVGSPRTPHARTGTEGRCSCAQECIA